MVCAGSILSCQQLKSDNHISISQRRGTSFRHIFDSFVNMHISLFNVFLVCDNDVVAVSQAVRASGAHNSCKSCQEQV